MWMTRLLAFLRRTLASRQAEQDLHDDVQGYADLVSDELIASGVAPHEARRRARVALGGVETVKESVRAGRAGAWLEESWRDMGYGLRGLRRSPGFATTAILTIGLGIGVNTTIFSVIDSALFKPLPYDRPEELVDLGHHVRAGLPMETTFIGGVDWQEIEEWRAERGLFQGVEAYNGGTPRQWLEQDEPVRVGAFTPGLPALLGVKPRVGRLFTAAEAETGADVVVIADALWARAFARRADAVGSPMTLDHRRLTIVGVMPATFRYGPAGGGKVMAWTALAERAVPGVPGSSGASPLFRLRTGLTPQTAYPLAEAVAHRMQEAHPADEPWKPEIIPLDRARSRQRTPLQSPLLLLLAAAGLVLLVSCANVANLLLTRGASRQEELAMRTALGASRGRLVRLLLAEGVAVALLGGVAAIVLAQWSLGAVVATIPARLSGGMFTVSAPELDWRVLLFALGATTLVAVLSAFWPAMSASRTALRQAAGSGGQTAGLTRARRRTSRVLQAAQIAMASVLAVTGGLVATSFVRLMTTDLGFDARGLGRVSFSLPAKYKSDDARRLAIAELIARVRATPGVRIAAIGYSPGSSGTGGFVLPGASKGSASSAIRNVGEGYFDTTGIRIVAGRPIQADDVASSARVAVIDETDARRVFGSESPLGRQFAYSPYVPELTIVGVASHVEMTDFAQPNPRVGVYLPDRLSSNFVFRTNGDLDVVVKNVRGALQAFDPGIRIASAGAATDAYEEMETYAAPRFYVVLVSVFAVLALITAAVGLYGLLAHSVGQRRREIGVRVALGSTPGQVRALVLKEAFGPVAGGLVAGSLAAWWATRLLGSLLYGIGPHDPRAFAIGALALVVTALFATIAPVRRATGVDPIVALRVE